MRNIPVFTTEYGVASLTLSEIPYRQEAYIRLQDTDTPDKLLVQCVDFCKACGAQRIYAAGHGYLDRYPLHTQIWEMWASRFALGETTAALFPVQEQTLDIWRSHYNARMAQVPNAATMTLSDGKKLLEEGSGYFIHRGETLLGIGKASGDMISAVAALVPGSGAELIAALCGALSEDRVRVEVASENHRAVRLYEKLGFVKTRQISVWYQVL